MNRKKISRKLILLSVIGVMCLSVIPMVKAGVPPFLGSAFGEQCIGHGAFFTKKTIDGSEESYFRIGWGLAIPLELDEGWNSRPPFKTTLYIDGVEITLRRCHILLKDVEDVHPETDEPITYDFHLWIWYQIFEPNYFSSGEHQVKSELWIMKNYGVDPREQGWRLYINYDGPEFMYGPQWPDPGSIAIAEHTLIVE